MTSVPPRSFRLAAFDLDGTLLGPDGTVSRDNEAALLDLHRRGIEIVLASGRHPLNMHRFVERLPIVRWIVAVQGGEVSDAKREQRLHTSYLLPDVARHALDLGLEFGFSPVLYVPDDICAVRDDPSVQLYAKLAGAQPRVRPAGDILAEPIFKILWIGRDQAQCDRAAADPRINAFARVRTHERIIEIVPPGVNKGTGLAVLAHHLGLTAQDAVVFGDGENDLPMFAWAGTSVAMPHGWPAAVARATFVAPDGPPESALARGIAQLFAPTKAP